MTISLLNNYRLIPVCQRRIQDFRKHLRWSGLHYYFTAQIRGHSRLVQSAAS